MSHMTKQQQWQRAATVMKYMTKSNPRLGPSEIDKITLVYLNHVRPTAPWEYAWSEVVRSLRDRSAKALAKRAKSA